MAKVNIQLTPISENRPTEKGVYLVECRAFCPEGFHIAVLDHDGRFSTDLYGSRINNYVTGWCKIEDKAESLFT